MRVVGGKGIAASSGWGGKAGISVKHAGSTSVGVGAGVALGTAVPWAGAADGEAQLIKPNTTNTQLNTVARIHTHLSAMYHCTSPCHHPAWDGLKLKVAVL